MVGLEGQTIGKYRVIERLGRGGMATVYKAFHPGLDRYVAIKTLHSHLYEGRNFLERFQQEAKAIASLRHPHIVQVFDFDVHDDIYYMVMEFISGGTLKAKMKNVSCAGRALPIPEVVRIIKQVSSALGYAHKNGMIHRDVKPANILLNQDDDVMLTDFGIARLLSQNTSNLTATGALVGTPAYISPEQGAGERDITPASDIYALGVIFYELLTGRVPFDADTPIAVIHKHIHEPLPSPHQINPELPISLERVILKSLAKAPEDRYQTTAELVQAVDSALETAAALDDRTREETQPKTVVSTPPPQGATRKMPSPFDTEPEATNASPAVSARREQVRPKKRKRFRPFLIGGIALISLVTFAVLALFGISYVFQGPDCATIRACEVKAYILRDEGNTREAVEYLEEALALVPPEAHPEHAELWCQKGEMNVELNQTQRALDDYALCFDWTEGNPDLESLRQEAVKRIQILNALQE